MGGIDMKKILGNLIIILYVVVAIFTTICLLNFNEYKVSEFGDKTLVIVGKDGYEKADKGDKIFFYDNDGIKIAEVQQINLL